MSGSVKKFLPPAAVGLVYVGLFIWQPDSARQSSGVLWDYFTEMILILPPVFVLMGLMDVWIPKKKIQKWLGKDSGLKGGFLSVVLGTLPTGPLYVAFPMAAALIRKGASITNIVLFLGSWAALKIPQLMVEIKFLGLSFAAARFVLTLAALTVTGLIMKSLLDKLPDKGLPKDSDAAPVQVQNNQMPADHAQGQDKRFA
jgi:uncharacterized membrane protein YraQ (UPF0718 family)